jgi:hypothetical protein
VRVPASPARALGRGPVAYPVSLQSAYPVSLAEPRLIWSIKERFRGLLKAWGYRRRSRENKFLVGEVRMMKLFVPSLGNPAAGRPIGGAQIRICSKVQPNDRAAGVARSSQARDLIRIAFIFISICASLLKSIISATGRTSWCW